MKKTKQRALIWIWFMVTFITFQFTDTILLHFLLCSHFFPINFVSFTSSSSTSTSVFVFLTFQLIFALYKSPHFRQFFSKILQEKSSKYNFPPSSPSSFQIYIPFLRKKKWFSYLASTLSLLNWPNILCLQWF